MTIEVRDFIVAGVDGTDDGLRAVQYAVREAQQLSCGVRLVHVLPETVPMAPMLPLISGETLTEVGGRIVNEAVHHLDGLPGVEQLDIERVVRGGPRVHALAEEADRSRLIVLGHRDRALLGRIFTASTTIGVATRAHRPVMCVPASWAPGAQYGHVVVGVDDPDRAEDILSEAFAAAAERGARLTVLHAWRLQSPYDDIIASRVDQTPWQGPVKARLEEQVHALLASYPELDVRVDVRHQEPAAALLDSTRSSDLLVLGRRSHSGPLGFYLGAVARTMIWAAQCPVQITPHAAPGDGQPSGRA
jgi:nucleotide-binding universal stress UspA family protein